MITPSFIVLANRGVLKAYQVEKTPGRGRMPRLVQEIKFREAHKRYQDKVTDQAGGFPAAGSKGHANAIAECHGMESEEDTRLFKAIAQKIVQIISQEEPKQWLFAAPAEINSSILKYVPSAQRNRLKRNIKHDFSKEPANALLQHFG